MGSDSVTQWAFPKRSTQCLVPYSENKGYASNPRRFNTKWTIGDNGKVREWLIYDRSTDEMYCSDCRMYGSEKAKSNPL